MAISNNSTGLRTGVCTSTTRPTAPYEGQHIYETDTDIEYVWNGSAWVVNYVSAASPVFTGTPTAPTATAGTNTTQLATMASKPWNVAWGMQTYTTATANDLTITTEELQITGSSFTAVTGRLYRITYYEPELYGSTSYMQVNIRNTSISGAIRQLHYVQLNGNNNVPSHLIWIGTLTAGATNFVATLSSYSGTGAAYRAANQVAYLAVEDIGPA